MRIPFENFGLDYPQMFALLVGGDNAPYELVTYQRRHNSSSWQLYATQTFRRVSDAIDCAYALYPRMHIVRIWQCQNEPQS